MTPMSYYHMTCGVHIDSQTLLDHRYLAIGITPQNSFCFFQCQSPLGCRYSAIRITLSGNLLKNFWGLDNSIAYFLRKLQFAGTCMLPQRHWKMRSGILPISLVLLAITKTPLSDNYKNMVATPVVCHCYDTGILGLANIFSRILDGLCSYCQWLFCILLLSIFLHNSHRLVECNFVQFICQLRENICNGAMAKMMPIFVLALMLIFSRCFVYES